MVPLVIIRPAPGNEASTAMARAAGLDARGFPLFEVVAKSWEAVSPEAFDAMLVGSAQVFLHGGRGLAALRALPVYAVGEATAAAARSAGFEVAGTGAGSLQALVGELSPGHRKLLRVAGQERIALTPPPGVTIEERIVYASQPRPLPDELGELLRQPAIALLHSAEAAHHLTAECVRLGIRRAPLRLAALSPRIAAAAGDGWGEVAAAPMPDDKALLALARQMCQDPWPGTRPNS
ncbi:MAG: uroporphyrinogen-III synthase [Novosphingobium sp.]